MRGRVGGGIAAEAAPASGVSAALDATEVCKVLLHGVLFVLLQLDLLPIYTQTRVVGMLQRYCHGWLLLHLSPVWKEQDVASVSRADLLRIEWNGMNETHAAAILLPAEGRTSLHPAVVAQRMVLVYPFCHTTTGRSLLHYRWRWTCWPCMQPCMNDIQRTHHTMSSYS